MNRLRWISLLMAAAALDAQTPDVIYDESRVPQYTLPDPLVMRNGERVRDFKTWTARRRPEILEIYQAEAYGRSPAKPAKLNAEIASIDKEALGGKDDPKMDLLIDLPAAAKTPAPVILGLSFAGNQTVAADPGIKLGEEWVKGVKRPAAEKSRGAEAQAAVS